MTSPNYRLVTRSDFDGLVCGMLLREADLINEIKFVHPKDMQNGTVPITSQDIITNLPYVDGCYLAFDHHSSEMVRTNGRQTYNHVIDPDAPSAARVVYDYYGGRSSFPRVSEELMTAVDRADSAQFSRDEILDPKGWVLLNFLMDARTGLGRFRDFQISNYDLMMQLIERCRDHTVEEVLALPDVKERIDLYNAHREKFVEQIRRCATLTASSWCWIFAARTSSTRATASWSTRSSPNATCRSMSCGACASRIPFSPSASRSSTVDRRWTSEPRASPITAAAIRRPEPARSPTKRRKRSSRS